MFFHVRKSRRGSGRDFFSRFFVIFYFFSIFLQPCPPNHYDLVLSSIIASIANVLLQDCWRKATYKFTSTQKNKRTTAVDQPVLASAASVQQPRSNETSTQLRNISRASFHRWPARPNTRLFSCSPTRRSVPPCNTAANIRKNTTRKIKIGEAQTQLVNMPKRKRLTAIWSKGRLPMNHWRKLLDLLVATARMI